MVTLTNWCRDWRGTVARLDADDEYVPITTKLEGKRYELLRISLYSEDHDGEKEYFETPVRQFDDNTGYFTHKVRDGGVGRFITRNKSTNRAYVLEPGEDLVAYNAMRERVSGPEFMRLMSQSEIGRKIARRARRAERKKLAVTATDADDAMEEKVRALVEENAVLFRERNEFQRRAASRGAE